VEDGVTRQTIRFRRQGREVEAAGFHPRTTFLDYLRLQERSLGTKEGCAEGDCGACTIVVGRNRDGRLVYEPVNACILLLGQVDGAEIVTVDDLATHDGLHPVQEALVAHHGSQCGFCTPGIVMSLFALYHEGARPVTRQAANDALAGNLCRCTGYRPIMDAALAVCAGEPQDAFTADKEVRGLQVAALADDRRDVMVGDGACFFAAPASEDALAALYAGHPDATLVAGCTDVGLWVTKGMAELDTIIWLGRIPEMAAIVADGEAVRLGATATHAQAFEALASIDPDLGEIMRRFGSVQVRASGTVGGSIANGSPIGDLAPPLIALEAILELRHGDGTRSIPLDEFFLAYRRQDRAPGEFVRCLIVPRLRADQVFRAYKVSKRFDEDISSVLGAFRFTLEGRRVAAARVAFGGMAGIPKRATETEAALAGALLDDATSLQAALAAIGRDFRPLDDHRASAAYRSVVARNLLWKALSEIAVGDTRSTRLAGHRDVLAVAE
jgi:xanthine dehydrogenase small subunit